MPSFILDLSKHRAYPFVNPAIKVTASDIDEELKEKIYQKNHDFVSKEFQSMGMVYNSMKSYAITFDAKMLIGKTIPEEHRKGMLHGKEKFETDMDIVNYFILAAHVKMEAGSSLKLSDKAAGVLCLSYSHPQNFLNAALIGIKKAVELVVPKPAPPVLNAYGKFVNGKNTVGTELHVRNCKLRNSL